METLFELEHGKSIVRYSCPAEAEGLIATLDEIAASLGWKPEGQIGEYRGNSEYFGVLVNGRLAGGLQLVVANGRDPLPVGRVWPEINLSLRTDVAHAAIMALRQEYRGMPGLFGALTVEMWRHCALHGIAEIWMEATPETHRLYTRMGWPLEAAGPSRLHWGEACAIYRMSTAGVAGNVVIRALRSEAQRSTLSSMVRMAPSAASVANMPAKCDTMAYEARSEAAIPAGAA